MICQSAQRSAVKRQGGLHGRRDDGQHLHDEQLALDLVAGSVILDAFLEMALQAVAWQHGVLAPVVGLQPALVQHVHPRAAEITTRKVTALDCWKNQ